MQSEENQKDTHKNKLVSTWKDTVSEIFLYCPLRFVLRPGFLSELNWGILQYQSVASFPAGLQNATNKAGN